MKSKLNRIALTVGLSTLMGSALLVASNSTEAVAEIPFGFQIANHALPAGTYAVEKMDAINVLVLRNRETGEAVMTATSATAYGKPGNPKLVFNHYGDRYFLSQIWLDSSTGQVLAPCKLEKEMSASSPTKGVLASIRLK